MAWDGMHYHDRPYEDVAGRFGSEYSSVYQPYDQMPGAYGQIPAPPHWYGREWHDWYQQSWASSSVGDRYAHGYTGARPIQHGPPMHAAPWDAEADAYWQWAGGNAYGNDWWQRRAMHGGYYPENDAGNQENTAEPDENASAKPEKPLEQKKGKRKRYEDDDRGRRGMPGDDVSLCYLCSCRYGQMLKLPNGDIYCTSCIDTYFAHKRNTIGPDDDSGLEDDRTEDIQVACPAERSVIRRSDAIPVSEAQIRQAKLLKEEVHRMSDWSIELTPQRVKASQPWAITGAQVLGTPKTGEWEDAYFDIFEYGERGWAYAVRLSDGMFGWLPYKFTVQVPDEKDPAPTCGDAEAAARHWFSIVNHAVLEEKESAEVDPWRPPAADPSKVDANEEAEALAEKWIADWSSDKRRDPADRFGGPERDPFLRTGDARARCVSPETAAAYLCISDDELPCPA